jgi:hypothetical protein
VEIDHDNLIVRVDWHGYAIDQVDSWVDKIVEAAWAHGFERVEFVHGAPERAVRGTAGFEGDPRERVARSRRRDPRGGPAGRGTIKDLLRRRLYGRRWNHWVSDPREGRNAVDEGSMTLALADNPEPDPSAKWPLLPPPAHPGR